MLDPLSIIEKSFAPCADTMGIDEVTKRKKAIVRARMSILVFCTPQCRIVVPGIKVLVELNYIDSTYHLGDEHEPPRIVLESPVKWNHA